MLNTKHRRRGTYQKTVGSARVRSLLKKMYTVVVPEYRVKGLYYDFAIPFARLLVEVDGATYHACFAKKKRDFVKQKVAEQEGWRLVRVKNCAHSAELLQKIIKKQL